MANYKPVKIIVPRFKEENGFYTTRARSELMAKIRFKNTKPEIMLRKGLWAAKIRYRISPAKLPGKPDIVIRKYRVVVFVDGEFWHGHNWDEKKLKINSNRGFWIPKIERNMQRDLENNEALNLLGYKVFRFWEREIKKDLEGCVSKIVNHIQS